MQLSPATDSQQWTLASVFDSFAALTQWGGEGFSMPLKRQSFLQQLQLPDTQSFVLQDARQQMLAFGQLCDRFERMHLARLLVLPPYRGQRLSSVLISELLAEGLRQWPQRAASLYVFRHNQAALRSYQRLGFTQAPHPGPHRTDLYFMTLNNQASHTLAATVATASQGIN